MATQFITEKDITSEILRRGMFSPRAKPVVIDGENFKNLFTAQTKSEVLRQIDTMLREALSSKKDDRIHGMEKAMAAATNSHDADELQALVAMFANHKEILRCAAANPYIDEKTQYMLMTDENCRHDAIIQRHLANNPAMTVSAMTVMYQHSNDRFARHLLALNAVSQSQLTSGENACSQLCSEISRDLDRVTGVAAISGIQNSEVLRAIAGRKDMLLGSDYLSEIARNKNTPDDVLKKLAKTDHNLFGHMSSRVVEVSSRAHNTLAWRQNNRNDHDSESSPYYAP